MRCVATKRVASHIIGNFKKGKKDQGIVRKKYRLVIESGGSSASAAFRHCWSLGAWLRIAGPRTSSTTEGRKATCSGPIDLSNKFL